MAEKRGAYHAELPRPVLLVHGIAARDASFEHSAVWGRVADALETRGRSVWFANQDAFGSARDNAEQIARALNHVLHQTGAPKAHIIAHSKGGIDVRAALRIPGFAEGVASIVTLATPHRGMRFCDTLARSCVLIPHVVAPLVNRWAHRMGDERPDALGALASLTTTYARSLDGPAPEPSQERPSMPFCSIAFRCAQRVTPMGIAVRMLDGENDGVVSLTSTEYARWIIIDADRNQKFDHANATDQNARDVRLTAPGGKSFDSVPKLIVHLVEAAEAAPETTPLYARIVS